MVKFFYRYLYYIDPRFENSRYVPGDILPKQSKVLGQICKLQDELVPEDKYWDLGGVISDYRFGQFSADEQSLTLIGWTLDEVKERMQLLSQSMGLKVLTNEEMAANLREFTMLQEIEAGLFLVYEEVTEEPFARPAVYIDCR